MRRTGTPTAASPSAMATPPARRGGAPKTRTTTAPASHPTTSARTDENETGAAIVRASMTPITTAHAHRRHARSTQGAVAVTTPASTATMSSVVVGCSMNQSSADAVSATAPAVGSSGTVSRPPSTSASTPPSTPDRSARHRRCVTATSAPPTNSTNPATQVRPTASVHQPGRQRVEPAREIVRPVDGLVAGQPLHHEHDHEGGRRHRDAEHIRRRPLGDRGWCLVDLDLRLQRGGTGGDGIDGSRVRRLARARAGRPVLGRSGAGLLCLHA